MKIALVTEELAHGAGSGGIGGAFHELALLLGRSDHDVDIFYVPTHANQARVDDLRSYYAAHDIEMLPIPIEQYVWSESAPENRAYAVFAHLRAQPATYDVVHFHDYKGLGHFCLAARKQRLAFPDTTFVVQVHGPTRWTLEANGHDFTHEDQLKIDFLERASIAAADVVVSPSRYMLDWLAGHGWHTPAGRTHVIQNPCAKLQAIRPRTATTAGASTTAPRRADEIVLFARHEERKGIVEFCNALDLLADELAEAGTQVTFLGPLGAINGEPSLTWLASRARGWRFPMAILPDLDRQAAAAYLVGNPRSLVVVPSPVENSPYTVLEAVVLGKSLLTSSEGGAPELLDPASAKKMTCSITGPTLAAALRRALAKTLCVPRLATGAEETERLWLALHAEATPVQSARPMETPAPSRLPTVTVAITHHERPGKLYDALLSIAGQTYPAMDVVVVDDGSATEATNDALRQMQPLFDRLGVRLLRQPNLYLGAARNHAVRETSSDYLLFLDDDDLAFPTLVATLVKAAEATGADIMGCLNLFMEEHRRPDSHPFPDRFAQKVSYVPLGGPLALAPLANVMGSATALIRRSAFDRLGGYTERHGVGHEDYEFYVRALQAGATVEVCPVPLYLYEVGRPSMISSTSQLKNFRRVSAAIETGANPEAWADLVSLNAGRRAAEHTDNLQVYLRRMNPHAALLHELTQLAANGPAYAAKTADLAHELGAHAYGRALGALAEQRANALGYEAGPAPRPRALDGKRRVPRAVVIEPMRDAHIMAALVDLALGHVAEAGVSFRLSVERERRLTGEQRRFLVALAARPCATPADLAPVVEALQRLTVPASIDRALAPVLFRILVRAGAADLTVQIVESALREDYAAYIAAYPDVHAFLEGTPERSLEHYVHYGVHEGRQGFGAASQLSSVLQEELGVEAPLPTLRAAIRALSGALPASIEAANEPGFAGPARMIAAE